MQQRLLGLRRVVAVFIVDGIGIVVIVLLLLLELVIVASVIGQLGLILGLIRVDGLVNAVFVRRSGRAGGGARTTDAVAAGGSRGRAAHWL